MSISGYYLSSFADIFYSLYLWVFFDASRSASRRVTLAYFDFLLLFATQASPVVAERVEDTLIDFVFLCRDSA